jgi:ribonuclease Y
MAMLKLSTSSPTSSRRLIPYRQRVPGARSETLETYIKRVEQLETIAKGFDGVAQAYALQAGREIRVMVIPDKVDDSAAVVMAQQLREKIENEMTYPGQIKVSVIREYRAVETAK